MDARTRFIELCGKAQEDLDLPVLLIDEAREIIYANRQADETFGSLTGLKSSFLFEDCPDGDCIELIEKTANAGAPAKLEITLADVEYTLSGVKLSDEDGKSYVFIMLEDISESKHLRKTIEKNLRRLKKETDIAKHIQDSILPIDDEYWETIKLTSKYVPAAELSGDVYDIIKLENGKILFYISDVSGHGIQASLLTVFVRENIRAQAEYASEALLPLLGRISKRYAELEINSAMYISLLLCLYDPAAGELALVNAGHNCYPIISRNGGRRVEEIPVRGLPISRISVGADYEEELLTLKPGDRIILYTDGLIEEFSRIEGGTFSSEGMRRVVEESPCLAPEALIRRIFTESEKYMLLSAKDDRTLLIADIL